MQGFTVTGLFAGQHNTGLHVSYGEFGDIYERRNKSWKGY